MDPVDLIPDSKAILKSIAAPGAMNIFERFLLSHINIQDNVDYQLMHRIEENPHKVGFINKYTDFYAAMDDQIVAYHTVEGFHGVDEISRLQVNAQIDSVEQNAKDQEVIALSYANKITFWNTCTQSEITLLSQPTKKEITWLSSENTLLSLEETGKLQIFDIQSSASIDASYVLPPNSKILGNSNGPLAMAFGNSIQLLDFRQEEIASSCPLPNVPTSAVWMPNAVFGAALGFDDGTLSLFSFKDNQVVIHQSIGTTPAPIFSLDFCPSRIGTAAVAINDTIYFATLPAWGFGHFQVSKSYKAHIANILDLHWQGNSTDIISCDSDHMIHINDVNNYIPLYEPTQ